MHIAVDAMGGDHAPGAIVGGVLRAAGNAGDCGILLVGDQKTLAAELERQGGAPAGIEIVHADEVVAMDEPAITPIRRKRRSSIRVAAELVRDGRAQALVSFGNTGATLIVGKMVIGAVDGVDRPALAAVFPNRSGHTVFLDVGANVDTRPAHLRQFAVMGHFYAQEVLRTEAPRVGLLSIGEEEAKGSDTTKKVYRLMRDMGLNFIGNIEGSDIFEGTADVVVCDGFVGNVVLKSGEALAGLMGAMLREELESSWRTRLGGLLARPALVNLKRRTDYSETGAVPLLGLEGGCFVGHGKSRPKAVANAIHQAAAFCTADLHTKIRSKVKELHTQEDHLLEPEVVAS